MTRIPSATHEEWEFAWLVLTGRWWEPVWFRRWVVRNQLRMSLPAPLVHLLAPVPTFWGTVL